MKKWWEERGRQRAAAKAKEEARRKTEEMLKRKAEAEAGRRERKEAKKWLRLAKKSLDDEDFQGALSIIMKNMYEEVLFQREYDEEVSKFAKDIGYRELVSEQIPHLSRDLTWDYSWGYLITRMAEEKEAAYKKELAAAEAAAKKEAAAAKKAAASFLASAAAAAKKPSRFTSEKIQPTEYMGREEIEAVAAVYGDVVLQAEGYAGPHANRLGVFELQQEMVQGRPTYKNPRTGMNLFYTTVGYWGVGHDTSAKTGLWQVQSAARTPGAITETWKVWVGDARRRAGGRWLEVPAANIVAQAAFEAAAAEAAEAKKEAAAAKKAAATKKRKAAATKKRKAAEAKRKAAEAKKKAAEAKKKAAATKKRKAAEAKQKAANEAVDAKQKAAVAEAGRKAKAKKKAAATKKAFQAHWQKLDKFCKDQDISDELQEMVAAAKKSKRMTPIDDVAYIHVKKWISESNMHPVIDSILNKREKRLTVDDGDYLFQYREHKALLEALGAGTKSMDWAKQLLESGFADNVEATEMVVDGMSVAAARKAYGLGPGPDPTPDPIPDTDDDEFDSDDEDNELLL